MEWKNTGVPIEKFTDNNLDIKTKISIILIFLCMEVIYIMVISIKGFTILRLLIPQLFVIGFILMMYIIPKIALSDLVEYIRWSPEYIYLKKPNGKIVKVDWGQVKYVKKNYFGNVSYDKEKQFEKLGDIYHPDYTFCYKTKYNIHCVYLGKEAGSKLYMANRRYGNTEPSKVKFTEMLLFWFIVFLILGVGIFTVWYWGYYM